MSVRFGLLTLLEQRPMHGYQLRQEFESSTGSTWPLNVGQVYTTLARLERDGLIEAAESAGDDETQRVWTITAAGRSEVRGWFSTPVRHSAPPRDELAIKLAMAVRTPGVDVRDDLSWLLVVDSLIFAAEAEVRWLDHCETRLARAAHRAAPSASPAASPAASPETEPVPAERKAPVR